jgi:hypothetical protein
VCDIATDKASGRDEFIGVFLKQSWQLIKGDVMLAFQFFFQQHEQHFKQLNNAHLVFIPKKADAIRVSDFQPIGLSHSIGKLFSKCLANRLAGDLNSIVSRAQSAFIKRRSIQDNFLYTQNLISALHQQKQPCLFLKLDIAKHLILFVGIFLWRYWRHSSMGRNRPPCDEIDKQLFTIVTLGDGLRCFGHGCRVMLC